MINLFFPPSLLWRYLFMSSHKRTFRLADWLRQVTTSVVSVSLLESFQLLWFLLAVKLLFSILTHQHNRLIDSFFPSVEWAISTRTHQSHQLYPGLTNIGMVVVTVFQNLLTTQQSPVKQNRAAQAPSTKEPWVQQAWEGNLRMDFLSRVVLWVQTLLCTCLLSVTTGLSHHQLKYHVFRNQLLIINTGMPCSACTLYHW